MKNRKEKSGRRGRSRLCVVQALYQLVMNSSSKEVVLKKFLNESAHLTEDEDLGEFDKDFFELLFVKIVDNLDEIDKIISGFLKEGWEIKRLNLVILNILRCGVAELKYLDVPFQVVINEYIEITRSFSNEEECQFVNGCLNSVKDFLAGKIVVNEALKKDEEVKNDDVAKV